MLIATSYSLIFLSKLSCLIVHLVLIFITDENIESGITRRHAHSRFDAPFDLACGRSCVQKFRMKEGLKRERNFP